VTDEQWADPTMHALGIYLDGTDAPDSGADGAPLLDDDFLILVNAWWEPVTFTIPPVRGAAQTWFIELDSYDRAVSPAREFPRHTGDQVVARPRSLSVLRAPRPDKDETDLPERSRVSPGLPGFDLSALNHRGPPQLMRLARHQLCVRPDKVDYTCGPPPAALLILRDRGGVRIRLVSGCLLFHETGLTFAIFETRLAAA
jgi:hypothetical protein